MAIDVDLVGTDQDVCDVHSCRSGIYIDPHRSRWIQANVKFYFFWGGARGKYIDLDLYVRNLVGSLDNYW